MSAVTAVSVFLNVLLVYLVLLISFGRGYFRGIQDEAADIPPKNPRPRFRRFYAKRHEDVTGISGTGVRVEGVVFSDGWGVTHWLDMPPMREPKTEVWHKPWWRRQGKDPFTKISGHGGKTEIVWIDEA